MAVDAMEPGASVLTRLTSGELSSRHLTEWCLSRIEATSAEVNAFVTVTADLALAQAQAADEARARGRMLGPLHGLPVAVKDNIDVADVRTTMGVALLRGERAVPGRRA